MIKVEKDNIKAEHRVLIERDKEQCIIVDVDGTCCDSDHRLFKREGKILWSVLLNPNLVSLDPPIYPIKALLSNYKKTKIIYMTGRSKKFKKITKKWFQKYNFPKSRLIMKKNPFEKDYIFKERELKKILKKYDVLFVIEDLEHNIEMFERLNMRVINANHLILLDFFKQYNDICSLSWY